jgi:hypothetical protein
MVKVLTILCFGNILRVFDCIINYVNNTEINKGNL